MSKKILAVIYIISVFSIIRPDAVFGCHSTCILPNYKCNGDVCLEKTTRECAGDSTCKKGELYPLNLCLAPVPGEDTVCFATTDSKLAVESTEEDIPLIFTSIEEDLQVRKPLLGISIPGLKLSEAKSQIDQDGYLYLPWIGEYITGIYNFGLGVASIVAVIMIIVQGFRIIASAGGEEKMNAYKRIGQIVAGMIILWGSYAILWNINPDLVTFKAFKIKYVEPEPLPFFSEPDSVEGEPPGELVVASGDNILNPQNQKISKELLSAVLEAARSLKTQGIQLAITSGIRDINKQIELIKINCQNPPGSTSCNARPGKPPTCILRNNDPKNCPHTTGRAIDAWGFKDGQQCVKMKECKTDKNSDPCHANPCQAAVITAMKQAGFCNLNSEAWHFEKPKMSGNCE